MKAFVLSLAAIVIIVVSAAFVMDGVMGVPADEAFSSQNVRLK